MVFEYRQIVLEDLQRFFGRFSWRFNTLEVFDYLPLARNDFARLDHMPGCFFKFGFVGGGAI